MLPLLTPRCNRQFQQLFKEDQLVTMKKNFIDVILRKLKFRRAPEVGDRMVEKVEELVERGLPDNEIYDILFDFVQNDLFQSKEYINSLVEEDLSFRQRDRVKALGKILVGFTNRRHSRGPYLDIGCGDGSLTMAIGEYLRATKISGCDVIQQEEKYDFDFTLLSKDNPYKLPYKNKSQKIITALMSLHHIEDIHAMLDEIHRVLHDKGIFVIREHAADIPFLPIYLDLMHGMYSMVWNNPREMEDFREHYSCYRTQSDMIETIENGSYPRFHLVYAGKPVGSWQHYYAVFVKASDDPKIISQAEDQFNWIR